MLTWAYVTWDRITFQNNKPPCYGTVRPTQLVEPIYPHTTQPRIHSLLFHARPWLWPAPWLLGPPIQYQAPDRALKSEPTVFWPAGADASGPVPKTFIGRGGGRCMRGRRG